MMRSLHLYPVCVQVITSTIPDAKRWGGGIPPAIIVSKSSITVIINNDSSTLDTLITVNCLIKISSLIGNGLMTLTVQGY